MSRHEDVRFSLQKYVATLFVSDLPTDETPVLAAVVVYSPVSKRVSGKKDLEAILFYQQPIVIQSLSGKMIGRQFEALPL